MRKPAPAYVATAVVIALAGSAAFAQTAGRTAAPGTVSSTTAGFAAAPGSDLSPTGTGQRYSATGPTPGFTGGTGPGTTAGSSAGTSTTTTNADGSVTMTTVNADGTRTLVTQNVDGSTTTTTLPTNLFNPALINGAVGGVTVDGERMLDERDRALAIDRDAQVVEIQERALLSADLARSSVSLNRVIKEAEKDRRRIGRNGQLLHSIAPRTNVDRSHEMPDDGPTPALSGLANGLVRR